LDCEILNVGTELLLGDIVNTNAQFLSQELACLGIGVKYISTVGDNAKRLKETLESALMGSDIVITTGGLGPTADDITKEVCSEVFDLPLELHDESLKRMESYFKNFLHPMPESNKKQAYMPKGAKVFKNDCGTAPGCAIKKGGKIIIMLPGPPRELKCIFNNEVRPFLQKFSNSVIVSKNIRTFGIGESAMAEKVEDLLKNSNPTVAPYAKSGEALLRVTAKAADKEEAERMLNPVIEDIKGRLGHVFYGTDCESLEQKVVQMLTQSGQTVAFAESCTGGNTAKRITDIPNSSKVFQCGIVAYSNGIKRKILGVDDESLKKYGAVSEQVAQEMAKGVYKISGSSIAVGITGISGPSSDDTDKPVGLSFIALTNGEHVWCSMINTGKDSQRSLNRNITSSNALNMIRAYLDGYIDEMGFTKIKF
jgi:nicotinamide-nucleotide amidase